MYKVISIPETYMGYRWMKCCGNCDTCTIRFLCFTTNDEIILTSYEAYEMFNSTVTTRRFIYERKCRTNA